MTNQLSRNPIVASLRSLREASGIERSELDQRLILGPGWIERFETGRSAPTIDMVFAILAELGVDPGNFFCNLEFSPEIQETAPSTVQRSIRAEADGTGLRFHFPYADFDAQYRLENAGIAEFEDVLLTLRNGLSTEPAPASGNESGVAVKSAAVADTFLRAMELWPGANPSDIWWFIVYRAYLDPFNHPARWARSSFEQSWKRTAGWALEQVLVRHYGTWLAERGINLFIPTAEQRVRFLGQLSVAGRLEADKVDVILTGLLDGKEQMFGVVHVKASFAERRTDDVPLSQMLISAGYTSPLWTMDCKSSPSALPINRGELGSADASPVDRRSAKRKDIEDDGFFSSCFSYNQRTAASDPQREMLAKIYVCDFTNCDDAFGRFIVQQWSQFQERRKES